MKVETIKEAPVLVPHAKDKNFTQTRKVIPAGTQLEGEIKIVEGLKDGKPFKFNIFQTNDNQIIYIKYVKPMEKTEIKLGADSQISSTKVNLPSSSNFGILPIGGALVGLGISYYFTKKNTVKYKHLVHLLGAVTGYAIGKYVQSSRKIKVQKAK